MLNFSLGVCGNNVGGLRIHCALNGRFSIAQYVPAFGLLKSGVVFKRFFRVYIQPLSTINFSFVYLLRGGFYSLSTRPINIMTNNKLITYC